MSMCVAVCVSVCDSRKYNSHKYVLSFSSFSVRRRRRRRQPVTIQFHKDQVNSNSKGQEDPFNGQYEHSYEAVNPLAHFAAGLEPVIEPVYDYVYSPGCHDNHQEEEDDDEGKVDSCHDTPC